MEFAVLALARRQKSIDPQLGPLVLVVHQFPFVVVEYDDAARLHHRPRQHCVAIDVGSHVTAIDVGEIESTSGNTQRRQDGCRTPFDLLDAVRKRGKVAIELRLGLGNELPEMRVELVLDVALERIDADDAS